MAVRAWAAYPPVWLEVPPVPSGIDGPAWRAESMSTPQGVRARPPVIAAALAAEFSIWIRPSSPDETAFEVRRTEIGNVRLPTHPESFQLDPQTRRIFANLPRADQIAVIDLAARRQIARWRVPGLRDNFPMALDDSGRRLAIVFWHPPRLVLLDAKTGAVRAELPACGDARGRVGAAGFRIRLSRFEVCRIEPIAAARSAPD